MSEKKICINPFTRFDIRIDGTVGCCCPPYTDYYSFGNFFENSVEEIWNGTQIQAFRKSILDGSYQYCHTEKCKNTDACFEDSDEYSEVMPNYPKIIDLSIDGHCNFKCGMCRDENNVDEENSKKMEEILNTKIIPILQNCEELFLNGGGEFFTSKVCKNLVKRTACLYPNLKYTILTNGLLCTPENLEEIGILNRKTTVSISLHTLNPKTHYEITRTPNALDKVLQNIKSMKQCYENNQLGYILLNFVISTYNYTEIRELAKFCDTNKLTGHFWEFRKWDSKMCQNYDEYNVTNEKHSAYPHLKELLQDNIFNSKYVILNELLENIKNSN